jgi:predicted neutral ceramidase superfamily lipid hydrolase
MDSVARKDSGMQSIRHGLLAGAFAGVLLLGLLFLDQGPADQFILVAQTFGLNGQNESKWIAALIILVLAIVLGGVFGTLLHQPTISRGTTLLWGAAVGVLWWVVLFVILGDMVEGLPFVLYTLLLYLVLCLVYGMVLGSLYSTFHKNTTNSL